MVANALWGLLHQWKQSNWQHRGKHTLWQDIVARVENLVVKVRHVDAHVPKSWATEEHQNSQQVDQAAKIEVAQVDLDWQHKGELCIAWWAHDTSGHQGRDATHGWARDRGVDLTMDTIAQQAKWLKPLWYGGEWLKYKYGEAWQMDYITLPQTHQGKRYVLTMVEATTGWLETYPVPRATAQNTILGLEKQVLWTGYLANTDLQLSVATIILHSQLAHKAVTITCLQCQYLHFPELPGKHAATQVSGCRECLGISLFTHGSRADSCVRCDQVDDLLCMVAELREEVERLRSIREAEKEIDWWCQALPPLRQEQEQQQPPVPLHNRYEALEVEGQSVEDGDDSLSRPEVLPRSEERTSRLTTTSTRKKRRVIVVGDSFLKGTEGPICRTDPPLREVCCLPGARVKDVTRVLPSLVRPLDYYPLLLFPVGGDEAATRSPRVIKRDFRALGQLLWAVTQEGTETPNLLTHGSVAGVIATDLLRGDVPRLEGVAASEDTRPESSRCAGYAWAQPKSSRVEQGDSEATGAKRETAVKHLKARKGCSSMKETRMTAQLKCLYTNARSMGNKQEELEAIVHQEKL
ncbi:hypothetical protein QYF61_021878 [Mycteria americana]|uniref:RNase H type-1 domain-containing protein n=1 Tax=Mycteria americana TaxID=33587 RepID=A0AAN7NW79_MYCAM|nr:hypothetical protein QYF61_021878 [Mycteria americana]